MESKYGMGIWNSIKELKKKEKKMKKKKKKKLEKTNLSSALNVHRKIVWISNCIDQILNGHWTSSTSSPNFFQEKLEFLYH